MLVIVLLCVFILLLLNLEDLLDLGFHALLYLLDLSLVVLFLNVEFAQVLKSVLKFLNFFLNLYVGRRAHTEGVKIEILEQFFINVIR